ncbi:bifunctional nicotinamidase/pyrazinamidase [Musicola paradisiaca]|uniref:Nicotinamidase n=1 Tax=Musicola paradisiaca (strain Ech703) TaxID=579405 RepID=C6C5W9_MUSP7|nr:bifunctional nicotinamidase/pyrazinamidase [Musicola paradisiaca]ACS85760.1 Nicotinamidase [Musicola paradisiaca Ech703]
MNKALLLIDVQNDFCPGGALAVADGDRVVDVANLAIDAAIKANITVIASQDWHPANHRSFAVNSGTEIGAMGDLDGLTQIWWPVHCVQNQPGAEFHPRLNQNAIEWVVRKGVQPDIDSYSAFFDNGHRASTGLHDWLHRRRITQLTIIGLATDYCVKYTVLDALELGYQTEVLVDGCRGVNLHPNDSQNALNEMSQRGATLIDLAHFINAPA